MTVEARLAVARDVLARLEPGEAARALRRGAVLVDIRPQADRERDGGVPGALLVERIVLEWRFDPASESRLDIASRDLPVIVMCNEGHASSLAAAALQELGVRRATDVVGGFAAWRDAGLPTVRADGPGMSSLPEQLPGEETERPLAGR